MTLDRGDTTFASFRDLLALPETTTFTESDGLQFAVGVSYPYSETTDGHAPLDIVYFLMEDEDQQEYELHECSQDELTEIKDGTGKFYPIDAS